jgi:hypothetical protein
MRSISVPTAGFAPALQGVHLVEEDGQIRSYGYVLSG